MDARLVGEGVAPDDRLVGLHRIARQARDQAAGAGELIFSTPVSIPISPARGAVRGNITNLPPARVAGLLVYPR